MERSLADPALNAMRRILRSAERGERRLAQATGLTASQVLVLQEIGRGGDVTPSEVAGALQLSQASITNIADRLEELQMLTRRKGVRDKRQVRLTLTERGMTMLENAPDLLQNRFNGPFGGLPDWEQAMVLCALERLAELLENDHGETAPMLREAPVEHAIA